MNSPSVVQDDDLPVNYGICFLKSVEEFWTSLKSTGLGQLPANWFIRNLWYYSKGAPFSVCKQYCVQQNFSGIGQFSGTTATRPYVWKIFQAFEHAWCLEFEPFNTWTGFEMIFLKLLPFRWWYCGCVTRPVLCMVSVTVIWRPEWWRHGTARVCETCIETSQSQTKGSWKTTFIIWNTRKNFFFTCTLFLGSVEFCQLLSSHDWSVRSVKIQWVTDMAVSQELLFLQKWFIYQYKGIHYTFQGSNLPIFLLSGKGKNCGGKVNFIATFPKERCHKIICVLITFGKVQKHSEK